MMNTCGTRLLQARNVAAALLLSAGTASSIDAQSPASPAVARCTTISAVISDQVPTAAVQQTSESSKSLAQLVSECLDRIDISASSNADLLRVAMFRSMFGEPDKARQVLKQIANQSGASDSVRADSLTRMAFTLSAAESARQAFAALVAEHIDSLPAATPLQKLTLHAQLLRRYTNTENDIGVRKQALSILSLARGIRAHVRTLEARTIPPGMMDAFILREASLSAARMLGNFGEEQQGIALLQQVRKDHPELDGKYFDAAFNVTEQRLRLVGKPARAIPSAHWFNAPDKTKALEFKGKVTLIGFTAHWCPPCHHTYVPLQALADTLGKDGLQVMFATEYFAVVSNPDKNVAEVDEATREYYAKQGVTFPIALRGPGLRNGELRSTTDSVNDFYALETIPQATIVDRKGIVRRTIVGWDPENAARLNELLRRLLNEK
jgi:thiol-disulfide isomerase/thioredoxin